MYGGHNAYLHLIYKNELYCNVMKNNNNGKENVAITISACTSAEYCMWKKYQIHTAP